MSNLYEAVFIFRQDTTVSEVNKGIEQLVQIIKSHKGKVLKHEYWGIKNLAYPIKKNKKGHYVMLILDVVKDALTDLNEKLRLSEDIIRDQIIGIKSFDGKDSIMMMYKDKDR